MGRVRVRQVRGRTDVELDREPVLLGAPPRDFDERRIDVDAVYDMTLNGPQPALRPRATADVHDLQRNGFSTLCLDEMDHATLDRRESLERLSGETGGRVVVEEGRVRAVVPG